MVTTDQGRGSESGQPRGVANERQIGGDHYKKHGETGEEHWDRQWRLFGPAWFIGNITKYVERYQYKDGMKDLEKARHYLDKLIELETAKAEAETPAAPSESGVSSPGDKRPRPPGCDHCWVMIDCTGMMQCRLCFRKTDHAAARVWMFNKSSGCQDTIDEVEAKMRDCVKTGGGAGMYVLSQANVRRSL